MSFVDAAAVEWVEALGNYVRLHLRGGAAGASPLLRATLDDVEARLGADFVRVRRSALVRAAAVRHCEPWGKGSWVLVLRDGTRVTSSRHYRARLDALFGD
ncbi:LytTR family DNA-binding domain-containing protein [Roseisolibacter sp. H3M3-2]|nr:LytTR family DNA-binding domain-containing protein [Roseisolibacter sp. H3M3-2]